MIIHRSKISVVSLALLIGAFVFLKDASGSSYYVGKDGNDEMGEGSAESPWQTIQGAIGKDIVANGDSIIVKEGIYTENVEVNKELIIKSENGPYQTTVAAEDETGHVFMVTASNVAIEGFTVYGATGCNDQAFFVCTIPAAGIFLANNANNCSIAGNICGGETESNYIGIALYGIPAVGSPSNNTISNNICTHNTTGLFTLLANNNIISGNTFNKGTTGIFTVISNNNAFSDNVCSENIFGVFMSVSNANTLSHNTLTENNAGLSIYVSNSNAYSENTASNNKYGCFIYLSNTNDVFNNTFTNNRFGIFLSNSNINRVRGNSSNNNQYGISLSGSASNEILLNTCTGNVSNDGTNTGNSGIRLNSSHSNTISGNTCNENNPYGIFLMFSNDNSVLSNTCNRNSIGIHLLSSGANLISAHNTCSKNTHDGIALTYSSRNIISENTCNQNAHGIDLNGTNSNDIDLGSIDLGGSIPVSARGNTLLGNTCSNNLNGIDLRGGVKNTAITMNTVRDNGEYGIFLSNSDSNFIYVNNFENIANVNSNSGNNWATFNAVTYFYSGQECSSNLGNHYADNHNPLLGCGITEAYSLGDASDDLYPLAELFANYSIDWALIDTDGDGVVDLEDQCPSDPQKTEPGICGCSIPDTNPQCNDFCPDNPDKIEPGVCGCDSPLNDSDDRDTDGTPDCKDECSDDRFKTEAGFCGCGVSDIDSDRDGISDCIDPCPHDSEKSEPGLCGCGVSEVDTDGDGAPDCIDECPENPSRQERGDDNCGNLPSASEDVDEGGGSANTCFINSATR